MVKSSINVSYGHAQIFYNWYVPFKLQGNIEVQHWCSRQFKQFDWYPCYQIMGIDEGYHFVNQRDALLFELRWG